MWAAKRNERVIYIIDELWLSFDELTYLGFRLLAVRLSSAGTPEMVVETRESPKLIVSDVDDQDFLRVCGIKVN